MSDVTRDQVIDFLSNLSVVQLTQLVADLEEDWGVEAATASAIVVQDPSRYTIIDDQVESAVELMGFGDEKIQVIKVVRAITGFGLKEAKALVDEAPSMLKEGLTRNEADALVQQIEEAGGQAVVR